ncbi:MAG: RNA degradosome polyphosphate kinase, partial [Chlorobiaceae bacterium]|nr:RNA degradosome polyphosphate kinase [Chlorobiaceae bacterium]
SIDLVVRGICCLKPGIAGISENIRVVSIIGRFLEHSRIYFFHNGGREEMYLGSADLMPRNLDHRVETIFPVFNKGLVHDIKSHLEIMLRDNVKSWCMNPDGMFTKKENGEPRVNSQAVFLEQSVLKKNYINLKQ